VSASGSGTFVSIVEIQTHVQQLVVQKHISFNSNFNCFTVSTRRLLRLFYMQLYGKKQNGGRLFRKAPPFINF
jgi:hypothetical protein